MFTLDQALQHPIVSLVHKHFGVTLTPENFTQGADYQIILDSGFDEFYARNLFKKVENVNIGVDPIEVAKNDFKDRLVRQSLTEEKVKYILSNPEEFPKIHAVLNIAKKRLSHLMRDFRHYYIKPRWTMGATKEVARNTDIFTRLKNPSGYLAMQRNLSILKGKYPLNINLDVLPSELPHEPKYLTMSLSEDIDSFFITAHVVPKTARIGRVVGLHPTSVIPVQNGLGDYLVDVCKRVGINISTAQELHKSLAMEHSLTGEYATSDQSNSSDNLLRVLVEHLLPSDIYDFMVAITPQHIEVDGERYHAKMMCPQGNGYIFPLQTLIFHTFVKALQKYYHLDDFPAYVYGDDVILHNSVYDYFNRFMEKVGFQPNLTKSHNTGPFRESCGGDYLYGINTRPMYVKTIPPVNVESNNDVIDWIKFVNGVRRVGYYNNGGAWRSGNFWRFWLECLHFIPAHKRLYAPRIYGDSAINLESEKRYKLSNPTKSLRLPFVNFGERKKWDYYPDSGSDREGRPYASEFISIYNAATTRGAMSFPDIVSGISNRIWFAYATDTSLRGSGQIPTLNNGEGVYTYPTVFGKTFDKYVVKNVPYSNFNTFESVDDVFSHLEKHGNPISDTDFTLKRYEFKRHVRIQKLVDTLVCVVNSRQKAINEVRNSGDL